MNQAKDREDAHQQKVILARYMGFVVKQKVPKVNQAIDSQGTFLEDSVRNIT